MGTNPTIHNVLYGDILCKILTCFEWKEVLKLRKVARSWKEAVADTPVQEQVHVTTERALVCLHRCIPKLQSLKMDQSSEMLLQDDEDDSLLLYHFSNIRHFQCLHTEPSLLQSYDLQRLWSHWGNLQSLNLHGNEQLEWRLSDLACLRQLKDLRCINNRCLRGDTRDLLQKRLDDKNDCNHTDRSNHLFHTLTILDISGCTHVTGQLGDFSKLPLLQWLGIHRTQVRGDLRTDIRPGHFVALQGMGLSQAVYGADKLQSVEDAPAVMRARLQIMKQSTWESPIYPLLVHLSPDSPDYHERLEQRLYTSERDPPFSIETVVVGKRWGWRWSNYLGGFCDTHWLDPEPATDCEDYMKESTDFLKVQSLFSGYFDPPTPEQYRDLCRERL